MPSTTTTTGTKDMTVHEINSGNSGPSEPETEDSPDVKEVVVQQENSSNHHIQRTSCFFEWRLLPQHKIEDGESQEDNVEKNSTFCKFKCDLCLEKVDGGIPGLKLHQIGLHINPYYLSASDRILAQISSYAVHTDKTEGPWIPDWDTFKGLYRCHECFLLCNDGTDLYQHLITHRVPVPEPEIKPSNEEEKEVEAQQSPKTREIKVVENLNVVVDNNAEDDLEDVPLVTLLKSPYKNKAKSKSPEKTTKTPEKTSKSPEKTTTKVAQQSEKAVKVNDSDLEIAIRDSDSSSKTLSDEGQNNHVESNAKKRHKKVKSKRSEKPTTLVQSEEENVIKEDPGPKIAIAESTKIPSDDVDSDQKTSAVELPNVTNDSRKDGGVGKYSLEFKLQIVEEAKEVNNNAQVARKHGISEASVRCWRKNEAKLKTSDIKNEGVQNSEIYDEEDIPLAKRQKLSITPPLAASDNKNSSQTKSPTSKRPDRRSKHNAKTLVAMLTADLLLPDHVVLNSGKKSSSAKEQPSSKSSVENKSKEKSSSGNSSDSSGENSMTSKSSKGSNKSKTTKGATIITKTISKLKNNAKSKTKETIKKKTKTTPPNSNSSNTKASSKTKRPMASTRKRPSKASNSTTTIHPAKISSSRRSSSNIVDAEKINLVVQSVTVEDKPFVCLKCGSQFATFVDLNVHKGQCHQELKPKYSALNYYSKKLPNISGEEIKKPYRLEQIIRIKEDNPLDLADFVSKATIKVPETTFNNMHGRLEDVSTEDGKIFAAKAGTMGTIEKVKMNMSENWTHIDVFESGWEFPSNALHWNKYDQDPLDKKVMMKMSHLSWFEQKGFQEVLNKFGNQQTTSSSSSSTFDSTTNNSSTTANSFELLSKKNKMIQGLDLKQLGRRRGGGGGIAKNKSTMISSSVQANKLNGEWESHHDFMCSTCAIVYDELREVLHHKWEAHPYCLVAHVTLRMDLKLPPMNMMYPQLGRSLTRYKTIKLMGSKKPNINKLALAKGENNTEFKCSKCYNTGIEAEPIVFETREDFYVHLLECGGHEDWDESKGKKKKKKLKSIPKSTSTETSEEKAEKRRARFEKFNQPPPLAVKNGGRMTRRQEEIIKTEKTKQKRKKSCKIGFKKRPSKSRSNNNKPKSQQASSATGPKKSTSTATSVVMPAPAKKKVIERKANNVTSYIRNRRSNAFYGSATPTSTPSTSTSANNLTEKVNDDTIKNNDNEEVFSIVHQIMEDMLNRIEKAAHVLDEAEKLNLDLSKAKEEVVKHRRASTESENNDSKFDSKSENNDNNVDEMQNNIQEDDPKNDDFTTSIEEEAETVNIVILKPEVNQMVPDIVKNDVQAKISSPVSKNTKKISSDTSENLKQSRRSSRSKSTNSSNNDQQTVEKNDLVAENGQQAKNNEIEIPTDDVNFKEKEVNKDLESINHEEENSNSDLNFDPEVDSKFDLKKNQDVKINVDGEQVKEITPISRNLDAEEKTKFPSPQNKKNKMRVRKSSIESIVRKIVQKVHQNNENIVAGTSTEKKVDELQKTDSNLFEKDVNTSSFTALITPDVENLEFQSKNSKMEDNTVVVQQPLENNQESTQKKKSNHSKSNKKRSSSTSARQSPSKKYKSSSLSQNQNNQIVNKQLKSDGNIELPPEVDDIVETHLENNHSDEKIDFESSKSDEINLERKSRSKERKSSSHQTVNKQPKSDDDMELPSAVDEMVESQLENNDFHEKIDLEKSTTEPDEINSAAEPNEPIVKDETEENSKFDSEFLENKEDSDQNDFNYEESYVRRTSIESNLSISDQNEPPGEIIDIIKENPQTISRQTVEQQNEFSGGSPNYNSTSGGSHLHETAAAAKQEPDFHQPHNLKKRRSSFAASFYASQPMSERSLRRSNGRISYVDDMDDLIKIDPNMADGDLVNEIRRKKRQHSNTTPNPTLVAEQTSSVSSKKRSKVNNSENIENNLTTTKKPEKKKHSRKSKKYSATSSSTPSIEEFPASEINLLEHATSPSKTSDNVHDDAISTEITKNDEVIFTENPERRPKRNQNVRINYVEDLDEVIKVEMDNDGLIPSSEIHTKKTKKKHHHHYSKSDLKFDSLFDSKSDSSSSTKKKYKAKKDKKNTSDNDDNVAAGEIVVNQHKKHHHKKKKKKKSSKKSSKQLLFDSDNDKQNTSSSSRSKTKSDQSQIFTHDQTLISRKKFDNNAVNQQHSITNIAAPSSSSRRSSRSNSLADSLDEQILENPRSQQSNNLINDVDINSSTDDEQRPRRHLNNNLMFEPMGSRVIFPLEVKSCAIQRIKDGATKVQVARDLGCPLSTVASWWHRRSSIVPDLANDIISESTSASESEPPYERMSQKIPLKKKKRKTLDLNRTVLLSQMKERVEAAFVAREQDKSENVAEIYSANHATSPIENNEDVIVTPGDNFTEKPYSEEEESEEKNIISRKNHHQSSTTNNHVFVATSEESSNDTDETGNDVKLKNVILRNCFASMHRRQQKEKEKEYDHYLNE